MDENKRKAFRELCNMVGDSMKNTSELMSAVFRFVDSGELEETPKKLEETPKKTLKKRQPRKAKTVEKKEVQEEIITLNMDAPVSYHNCEDKGCGKIHFDILEDDSNGGGAGTQSKEEGIQAVLLQ